MRNRRWRPISAVERITIDRQWRELLTTAYIHTLTGNDAPSAVYMAGRIVFVISHAMEGTGHHADEPDMRILADASDALMQQAGRGPVMDEDLRARMAAGLAVCDRMAKVLPRKSIVDGACTLELMLRGKPTR